MGSGSGGSGLLPRLALRRACILKKTLPVEALVDRLRAVARGDVWIEGSPEQSSDGAERRSAPRLTPREKQIVQQICEGLKNKEIAQALSITAGTVKVHLMHIFEKTGVKTASSWLFRAANCSAWTRPDPQDGTAFRGSTGTGAKVHARPGRITRVVNPTQTIPVVSPASAELPGPATVPLYAVLAVLAFCAFWTLLGSILVPGARLHDFLNLYTGASLARDGVFAGMHVPEVQLQREQDYAPRLPELVPFVRLPFYALLLTPLAWLPFGIAFWAWLGLQAAVLAGTWVWAFRRWGADALIFGSMYLPTALGIAHGQDCVLILSIVLGSAPSRTAGKIS